MGVKAALAVIVTDTYATCFWYLEIIVTICYVHRSFVIQMLFAQLLSLFNELCIEDKNRQNGSFSHMCVKSLTSVKKPG